MIIDGLTGDRFAVMLGGGSYLVADRHAPLEHGCPVVLQADPGKWITGAHIVTKHPEKAKTLRVDFGDGNVLRVTNRMLVARVVGKFIAKALRDVPDLPERRKRRTRR